MALVLSIAGPGLCGVAVGAKTIPRQLTRRVPVAAACRGRLADRHRLQFHSDADQDAIQAIVSPAMWQLLSAAPDDSVDVSLRNLPRLLDEVEAPRE